MSKLFLSNGHIDEAAIDAGFLDRLQNFEPVITAAAQTGSARIESTHFLLALLRIENSLAREFFLRHQLPFRDLESGLIACCHRSTGGTVPPRKLTYDVLDNSARRMVSYLEAGPITESFFFLAVLENLTPEVIDTIRISRLDHRELIADARRKHQQIIDYIPPRIFDGDRLCVESFSPGGQRVIELMMREAGGLGFETMDPRHLLLALLEHEGGAARTAIYRQDLEPKKIHQHIMVNLRGQAKKEPTRLPALRNRMSGLLVAVLDQSSVEAGADLWKTIAEVHLFRAFLKTDTFALGLFRNVGVVLDSARSTAADFKPGEEPEVVAPGGARSMEAIKASLEESIVGQPDALGACLPIIRRMLFNFRQPGKPAGVFILCGPSGMGKTEMAKAMAQAVFGGADNLVMLEMGQFQTKESMNIFVGAPPGYVGYGEGKLTNGIRDKPRSVVLFDEIEKAHPEVFDALLRFIDEGKIDDPAGPVRDGSECIIVMTSNVRTDGLEKLVEKNGCRENKWAIRRKLKEALLNLPDESKGKAGERKSFQFRHEFLNRVDEIILFRALDEDDFTEIARRHLIVFRRRLEEEKGILLRYSPTIGGAARLIGRFCSSVDEGARAALRVCHTAVIDPVVDFVTENACEFPVSLAIHFNANPNVPEEPQGVVDFHH